MFKWLMYLNASQTFYEYIICIYFMNVFHEYIKRIGIFYEYIIYY